MAPAPRREMEESASLLRLRTLYDALRVSKRAGAGDAEGAGAGPSAGRRAAASQPKSNLRDAKPQRGRTGRTRTKQVRTHTHTHTHCARTRRWGEVGRCGCTLAE